MWASTDAYNNDEVLGDIEGADAVYLLAVDAQPTSINQGPPFGLQPADPIMSFPKTGLWQRVAFTRFHNGSFNTFVVGPGTWRLYRSGAGVDAAAKVTVVDCPAK